MSYLLIRVHSFTCDYPGCTAEEEHAEPTVEAARKIITRYGWTILPRGLHYCPKHKP